MPMDKTPDVEQGQVRKALGKLAKELHERNERERNNDWDENQIIMMHSGPAWDADDWR